ncbi:MAG: hypothetical protein JJU46_14445 [Balneolaceae bacterium]|nr:hypothetical protein [Balneolaceae bacterium]MCH8550208.1 hypothetical protein [Balneolaceae bacterium]
MIRKLISLAVVAVLFVGCNSLFDTGDVEGTIDTDDPQVGLFPLTNQTNLEDGGTVIEVQLIAEQRGNDLSVEFSIDSESSAEEGVHYELVTPSPVVIEAGESTTDIVIDYLPEGFDDGGEDIIINLEGTDSDVRVAPNFETSTTTIAN